MKFNTSQAGEDLEAVMGLLRDDPKFAKEFDEAIEQELQDQKKQLKKFKVKKRNFVNGKFVGDKL